MSETTRFEEASTLFAGSPDEPLTTTKNVICPECDTPFVLTHVVRGRSVRVWGACPEGHEIDRYGYVQEAVA